jgi:quercetin dioxygenase-like cupin family protein
LSKSISFNLNKVDWKKFKKGNAKKIYSKDLNPEGIIKNLTIKLMRIQPEGEFPSHVDPYAHFFYLISGIGEVQIGDMIQQIEKDHIITIKAGEKHGYRNNGVKEMYMLTMNIPNSRS